MFSVNDPERHHYQNIHFIQIVVFFKSNGLKTCDFYTMEWIEKINVSFCFPCPPANFPVSRCRRKFRPKRWLTRWSPLRLPRQLLLNNTLQFLRKVYFLFNGCRAYSKEKGFSLKICLLELSRRICVQMFTCSSQERPLGLKPSRAGYRRS